MAFIGQMQIGDFVGGSGYMCVSRRGFDVFGDIRDPAVQPGIDADECGKKDQKSITAGTPTTRPDVRRRAVCGRSPARR